mgnify:CR=1 FL=1
MPGLTGFEVLDALAPGERPIVIFSTAYDEYALAAFEVHAVDYLLKPFSDERFEEALRRAEQVLRVERLDDWHERLQHLLASVAIGAGRAARSSAGDRLDRIAVRRKDRLVVVETASVDWIEAAPDYVRLHVAGETHLLRMALAELERRLDPGRFVRLHRSTIVQHDRVRELYVDPHGDYFAVLRDGTRLRVGRSYRTEVLRRLGVP